MVKSGKLETLLVNITASGPYNVWVINFAVTVLDERNIYASICIGLIKIAVSAIMVQISYFLKVWSRFNGDFVTNDEYDLINFR